MEQNEVKEVKVSEVKSEPKPELKADEKVKDKPKPELKADEKVKEKPEDEKKATISLVLACIALVFLAGTKFIFGAFFFYLVAFIFALIAFIFALRPEELTKKVIVAIVISAAPLAIAGYNLVGIAARDAVIDLTFKNIEREVKDDLRDIFANPAITRDIEDTYNKFDKDMQQDYREFQQRVREDAAKESTADQNTTTSDSTTK